MSGDETLPLDLWLAMDSLALYEISAADPYAEAWRACYEVSRTGRFFVAHESVFLELLRRANSETPENHSPTPENQ